MEKKVASLSELGWVDSTELVLSKLLGYYILTDARQSIIFQNKLINLPVIYHLHINDPTAMASAVNQDLTNLLGRYYDTVDVEVTAVEISPSTYGIVIYASVIDSTGVRVALGKVVDMTTTGVRKVIDISNYGDGLSYLESM